MTMMSLMMIMTGLSFSLFLASTPLSLGLWIIFLALTISGFISLSLHTWISFILFLIYISGLLVMFAYFVAIQPNQQLELSKMLLAFTTTMLIMDFPMESIMLLPNTFSPHTNPTINTMYSSANLPILILLATILFLALVAVVKIAQNFQGPLRPFVYA